jgi:hypothetical protein
LTDSFLSAIEAIAIGDSPLAFASGSLEVNRTQKRFDGIDAWVTSRNDGSPLASIPLLIPLNCSSAEMVPIEQVQGFDDDSGERRIVHVAHVPNCSFTESRSSGIYYDDDMGVTDDHAYILEYSFTTEAAHESSIGQYGLLQNGNSFPQKVIQVPVRDRELARDRQPSWQEGRSVQGIDGIQFGTNRLNLASAFIASGPPLWIDSTTDIQAGTSSWTLQYSYLLVGAVEEGGCPPLLSGAVGRNLACMAFVELECDQFAEDVERTKDQFIQADPTCKVGNMGMVWGRNFLADSTLASMVAGVYGRVQPHPFSYKHRAFMRNCIPAAMFALGTLSEVLSVESVVRAQVNGVYIFFMLFPLLLATGLCITVCVRRDGRDVPRNPYHMLMLGKHCHQNVDIPDKTSGQFPTNCNRRLVLKRKFNTDGTEEDVLEIGHDFNRPLEDPFFRWLIRSRLHGRDEDFKNAWYRKKIYQGYDLDMSDNHEKPSLRMVHDKILFGFAETKLEERLEFLEPNERAIWFGLNSIPKAVGDQECPVTPVPSSFISHNKRKNIAKTSDHSATHAADDSSRSNDMDVLASDSAVNQVACTKERHKIRADMTYCAICLHSSASKENSDKMCQRVRKGCPGCHVAVCKDHWKDFDHNPSNWTFHQS